MESKKEGIAMITRTKKSRVKVPRIKGLPHRRKTLVDTFLKRLTVFEIAPRSLRTRMRGNNSSRVSGFIKVWLVTVGINQFVPMMRRLR